MTRCFARSFPAALSFVLTAVLRAYQLLLSPILGPRCRFAPGCSTYALEAIAVHGPMRGVWLAAKRVARCHPWGGEGFDPVPAARMTGCAHNHSAAGAEHRFFSGH